jgi:two-component system NtrC family sensor kinase
VTTESDLIAELEARLAARDKTIAALIRRVEEAMETESQSDFAVLEQNILLERIVAQKTQELMSERAHLADALSALQQTQTQLLQGQKLEAIGQLAAGIAHEINTPAQYVSDNTAFLTKVFSRLQEVLAAYQAALNDAEAGLLTPTRIAEVKSVLVKNKLDFVLKEIPRALEQSREGLQRIATIVLAMKDFSHPSAGRKRIIDLAKLIETTVTVARNEWKYVADVATDFADDAREVACLRDELSQVILNLIVNAAHAIAAKTDGGQAGKGKITVGTRHLAAPPQIEIFVRDTGAGIPLAVQSRVFEPFFTTKPVGKGTGQGLAIAWSVVVDKHGGTLTFESAPGEGTTFYVRIPAEAPEGEGGHADSVR